MVATKAKSDALKAEGRATKDRDHGLKAEEKTSKALKQTDAWLAATKRARDQGEKVIELLVEAFRSPDPAQDGETVRVVEVLDRSVAKLGRDSAVSADIKGALLDALGRTYRGLGLFEKAIATLARAVAE